MSITKRNLYTKGQLFDHQSKLKQIPVPSLDDTCALYLETIKPFVNESEFKTTASLVNEFKHGKGKELQQRLLQRAEEKGDRGWFIDWWNDYAYMGYRDPVVLNVNYFFAFKDDKLRMKPSLRAASIITGAMQFRDLVVSGELAPESTKNGPLCSEQYKYLFNSTRIPQIPSDVTRTSDPNENSHIIVLRKNQFYKLDLKKVDGTYLNTSEIERQLDYIYSAAGSDQDAAVGALTTENRDVWTKIREELLNISANNQKSFDIIETAAFVVCLDDTKPITKEEHSREAWHGDGQNRFFDKSMQFIIHDNGKAAANKIDLGPKSIGHLDAPVKLTFDLNAKVFGAINKAIKQFNDNCAKHQLNVVTFDGYGKNQIKKFGVSPDAYAQMAIQLAYYKLHGVSRATYESAGTRKFKHGRTEAGRTVSVDTVAWVKAMVNPEISSEEKGNLGRKAIKTQSAYMAASGDGRGVDRHFLGLRLLLRPDEQKPAIFTDPAFSKSCHWNLSTSQVTSEFYDGYGWGQVVDDGYGMILTFIKLLGIAYMVKNNSLQFNVVSKFLKNEYMQTYFHEALNEMREVFAITAPPPKAKL
ncbi:Carnitine O-acetyltransferase mitochondrial [Globomyces sp. JEL0801]|nr:Carnitine O-acetyltransferase mitochondrial [Globomyces sp. JEL0801]